MVTVAEGVHRFGSSLVNWYVIEEAGKLTIVDTGMPAYYKQLQPALEELGKTLDDVEAIVLTHTHLDHVGFCERARSATGASVHVHQLEASPGLKRVPPLRLYLRPQSWALAAHLLKTGLLKLPDIGPSTTFVDGQVLDVPGSLRVIHTPGHTSGSCCLHAPQHDALFTGDALVTLDPYTKLKGPRIMIDTVNESTSTAVASLQSVCGVDASYVLPGHGDPWRGGVAGAVERAMRSFRSAEGT